MGHFRVLVIGNDVEKQMQPFHEFECTCIDDEYVQELDITDACREHGLDHYGLRECVVTCEDQIDRDGVHKFGFAVMHGDKLIKAVQRTNPNMKWDWWHSGEHDQQFFRLKEPRAESEQRARAEETKSQHESSRLRWWQIGSHLRGLFNRKSPINGRYRAPIPSAAGGDQGLTRADQARKGDIDFKRMRDDAAASAGLAWDAVREITGDLDDLITLKEMRRQHGPENWDTARTAYSAQRPVVAIEEAQRAGMESAWVDLDRFKPSREAYCLHAADQALSTFALLKDGEWYEPDSKAWYEPAPGERIGQTWDREFCVLLDGLDDDALLTVVYYHH